VAVEDFTTYTEVDPNGHITVSANTVDVSALGMDEDAYVYKDFGVDHFKGDFEHLLDLTLTSGSGDGAWALAHSLTNLVDDWHTIHAGGGDELGVSYEWDEDTGKWYIRLHEVASGSGARDDSSTYDADSFYLKFKRDESVGTYGTLYCYIYSDAARTNLLETLSLSLHAKTDFRYCYATQSVNPGYDRCVTATIANLDLQSEWSGKFLGVTSPLKALGLTSPSKIIGVSG